MLEFKKCKQCKETKHFTEFHFQLSNCHRVDDLSGRCKECQSKERMLTHAKLRARKKKIECTITKQDIIIPAVCPVLGIVLQYNKKYVGENSPTLDRIDITKGYIPGNVVVISMRANRLKSNALLDELLKIADFYKKYLKNEKKFLTNLKNMVQRKI